MSTNTLSTIDRYDVFVPETYKDSAGIEQTNLLKVGDGFPFRHRNGEGLSLELRVLPIHGKLVIKRHIPEESALRKNPYEKCS